MVKKLHLYILLCLIFVSYGAQAQGKLLFERETQDFGSIPEGTQATYVFRVKNVGDQALLITDVQASCGCTTPSWTKEPLMPGKIGTIKAVYNSTGRPGAFHKSIIVRSTAENEIATLYLKGEVVPKEAKNEYTPEQKARSPRLAVGRSSYSFGNLEKGQKAAAKFLIRNNGLEPLVIQEVKSACNCVSYRTSVPEIKAGQVATLELTYVPGVLKEQIEEVTVLSNDIVMPRLRLKLKANVTEAKVIKDMAREGN